MLLTSACRAARLAACPETPDTPPAGRSLTSSTGPTPEPGPSTNPVQQDAHFVTVCGYVEANRLRAGLMRRAEDWPWGSLACRTGQLDKARALLSDWPVARPAKWLALVNAVQAASELEALRELAVRGKPFGEPGWAARMADRPGLPSTLRPAGRPKAERNLPKMASDPFSNPLMRTFGRIIDMEGRCSSRARLFANITKLTSTPSWQAVSSLWMPFSWQG